MLIGMNDCHFSITPEYSFHKSREIKDIDPTTQFAPWEIEESYVDLASSQYPFLMGEKNYDYRPPTANIKANQLPNPTPDPDVHNLSGNKLSTKASEKNKVDFYFKKQKAPKEVTKKQHRPCSSKLNIFAKANKDTNSSTSIASNNTIKNSVNYESDQQKLNPKHVRKHSEKHENKQLRLKERHLSEQFSPQSLDHTHNNLVSFSKHISSIFEKKQNEGTEKLETNEDKYYSESLESHVKTMEMQNSLDNLDQNKLEIGGWSSNSYIFIQETHETRDDQSKDIQLAHLPNKNDHRDSRAKEVKINIPDNTLAGSKSTQDCNTSDILNTLEDDSLTLNSKDEMRIRQVKPKQELHMTTTIISSKNLTGYAPPVLGRVRPIGRIDSANKKEYTLSVDNKPGVLGNQGARPSTVKQRVIFKSSSKFLGSEENSSQYIPAMIEYYKDNKRRYLYQVIGTSVNDLHKADDFENYKISQIPLLKPLIRVDKKTKSGTASNARSKDHSKLLDNSYSQEKPAIQVIRRSIKPKENLPNEKIGNKNNFRGMLEICLKEKMANLNVIHTRKIDPSPEKYKSYQQQINMSFAEKKVVVTHKAFAVKNHMRNSPIIQVIDRRNKRNIGEEL